VIISELHVYVDSETRSAAANMAIDEALLECATAPSLRFYRWRSPSLSFGYFGAYADVAADEERREIVRRWTGGGIVLHGDDQTYSFILPQTGTNPRPSSRAVYSDVHEAIRRALATHLKAELALENAPKNSEACFSNPVVADVLAEGRKIAGAAHRRTHAGLLHQGSIQYDALPTEFTRAFAATLCPTFVPKRFTTELLQRAETLVQCKYATAAWLRRR